MITAYKSSRENVLEKLVGCVTRGASVELTLHRGTKISHFRVHEVIAPEYVHARPAASQARARGIVCPDRGSHRDEYVQVSDIASVRDERLAPFVASADFFERHPLPPRWVRLARCPLNPAR
jgi:hypothetical protein